MNDLSKIPGFVESIFDSISFGMLVISIDNKLELINERARKILGLENQSLESINIQKIFPNISEIIFKAEDNKRSFVENIFIDNTSFKISLEINKIIREEEMIGVVIQILDIKEDKKDNKYFYTEASYSFDNIIGKSIQIKELIYKSKEIASSPSTVLITGDSGSGKELLAQAIHNESNRRNKPFIAVNCGAIPKNLIESELFGYDEGSFTGARKGGSIGKFELASGGTIFLDEIGEMPIDMQVSLLRVLQEGYITRIGGKKDIAIDVRVITATNKDLKKQIRDGLFREDLFYRLSVIPLKIPPLKDRLGDVPVLIDHFLNIKSSKLGKNIPYITGDLYKKMISYCWPGNVRELENCVENIVNLNGRTTYEIDFDECTCMTRDNLGNPIEKKSDNDYSCLDKGIEEAPIGEEIIPLEDMIKKAIENTISVCGGNISKAATMLGVSRNTLYNKMKKHEIN